MTLPHDIDAEDGVLGCVLLDGANALAKVLEAKITPECFFDEQRRNMWHGIIWLHKRGLAIEAHLLAAELKRTKKLGGVGGTETIAEVTAKVPTTAQFAVHLERLRDLYVQRRLIENAQSVIEQAQEGVASVETYVQATHDILAIKHATEKVKTLEQAADDSIAHAIRIMEGKEVEEDKGLAWPWRTWNERFGAARGGELIILAARPGMGKSSAARQAALEWIKKGDVLLFSREMPMGQLPPLFAQQMSGVSWKDYRNGVPMDKQREYMKALESVRGIKTLHIFDHDRTLAQVTSRIRAYAQLHPIKAVIVDYLQRYDPQQEKGETRDMALGRMSMAFKDIAVDLNIPALVLAQVGRGMEREKRQPFLSDLRECLSVKDTYIFTPQGVREPDAGPMTVVAMDDMGSIGAVDSRYAPREDAPEFVRIKLQTGRDIVCTPKHPIMTDRGWVEAGDITNESIAMARTIPAPRNTENYSFAKWIGWMLGNGSMTGYASPTFICSCEVVAKAFCEVSRALWGFDPKPHKHKCQAVYQYDLTCSSVRTPEGNPVKNWLRQHGLWGPKGPEKHIPDWFCETADNESLAELVAGLWETDGCVISWPRPSVSFSTTSKRLAWQVVWALHRLGIVTAMEDPYLSEKGNYPVYKLRIGNKAEVRRFREKIKLIGRKGDKLAALNLEQDGNTAGSRLSRPVAESLKAVCELECLTSADIGYKFQGKRISQGDLSRIVGVLERRGWESPTYRKLINPDIYWDKIRHITREPGGPVFDRVVPQLHNFVANGVIVHNSGNLEQDADRVVFLWAPESRPDGSSQDPFDGSVSELYVEAIQAKGRGEGQDRAGMSFFRKTTTFRDITHNTIHKENML